VAAGSAQAIRERSEALEDSTTVDDKAIQNAQNLLLTFQDIDKKGFQPTLEAAIDLNAALGGDDQSLQGVLLQVGKAVNDPLRGLTALRRSGVSFTKAEQDKIKALVKSNDLYGAQQVILHALNTQFGGAAAAQADTYAGKMRRVGDAVEDAQMALATAFLPVLEKVGDKLGDLLKDPQSLAAIEDFGKTLADGLDDAIEIAGQLPWGAIGSTFKLMGEGAKTALELFTSAPPWLQTAVLTGWGLNKLTGGAAGNIIGALGSGLIKGVLGMNAGVVNINAGVVNGGLGGPGGLPLAAGGGALLVALTAGTLAAIAVAFVASQMVPQDPFAHPGDVITPGRGFGRPAEHGQRGMVLDRGTTAASVREGTDPLTSEFKRSRATSAQLVSLARQEQARQSADAARQLDRLRAVAVSADRLAAKDFSPNVSVTANLTNIVSVSAQQVVKTTTRIAGATTVGGFIESFG
jgi:hypothetical protein